MKLAAKLMLVFFGIVIILTGVSSYFAVWRGLDRLERQQAAYADRMAQHLEQRLQSVWQTQGPEGIIEMLQRDGENWSDVRMRWVWFEADAPEQYRPVAPLEQLRPVIQGQMVSVITRSTTGMRFLHTYCPMRIDSDRPGGLELTASLHPLDEQAKAALTVGLMTIGVMAVAGVIVSWLVGVYWVVRPLDQLIEKTRRVGQGDFSKPLKLKGQDELSQLATALNEMCRQLEDQQQMIVTETAERLAAMEQLRHADRLRTVGRLAAGLAHELGTPLNVVSGRAGLIASGKLMPDEVLQSATTIKSEADRITGIVRQLLDFARRRQPQRIAIDLRIIARRTVELLQPLAKKRDVSVLLTSDEDPVTACIDQDQIQQVLTNLVMNAIQAVDQGGEVRLRLGSELQIDNRTGESAPRDYALIAVEDQGVGISEEQLEHIFEPFYTTKDVGEGTGLGLSIVHGIIQEHQGWIDVSSSPGMGTCFTVFLPKESEICTDES